VSPRKLKQKWNFEADVPRCGNCKSFLRAKTKLVEGNVVRMVSKCRAGQFACTENDGCDQWTGRDGSRLV
jgi:hypothetical protein